MTSVINGGTRSASFPGLFTPRAISSFSLWIGKWVGPRALVEAVPLYYVQVEYETFSMWKAFEGKKASCYMTPNNNVCSFSSLRTINFYLQ
jgi:hypothetical protein